MAHFKSVLSGSSGSIRSAMALGTPTKPDRRTGQWAGFVGLLLLLLVHGVVNHRWIASDMTLRAYDMAPHLYAATRCREVLSEEGLRGALRILRGGESRLTWPSASYLPIALLGALVGHDLEDFRLFSLFYLFILFYSLYRIGCRLHSRGAGLLAAALVGNYPLVFGTARQVEQDLPGTAMLALSLALLLRTRGFSRLGASLVFGLALGGMILVRPPGLFSILAPLVLYATLALLWPSSGPRRACLVGLLLAGLTCAAVSSPWWGGRISLIIKEFSWHYQGPSRPAPMVTNPSFNPGPPPPVPQTPVATKALPSPSLIRAEYYLRILPIALADGQIVFLVMGLFSLSMLIRHPLYRRGWLQNPKITIILAWLGGGTAFLVTTFFYDLRYLMPLCPALALLTAVGLLSVPGRRFKGGLVALALSTGIGNLLWNSFGYPEPVRFFNRTDDPTFPHERAIYVTSGPPRRNPILVAALDIGTELRHLHASGEAVLIRLIPEGADIIWSHVKPMFVTLVPGVRFTHSRLGDPRGEDPREGFITVGSASVPMVRVPEPRTCYRLVYSSGEPRIYPEDEALPRQPVVKRGYHHAYSPGKRLILELSRYQTCPRHQVRETASW